MTVSFIDGFDHYSSAISGAAGLDAAWTVGGTQNITFHTPGLNGYSGRKIRLNAGTALGYTMQRVIPSTQQLSVAFAILFPALNTNAMQQLVYIRDSLGNTQFILCTTVTGKLCLVGEGGAVLATSDTGLQANVVYRMNFTVDMTVANATAIQFWITATQDAGLSGTFDLQDSVNQEMGSMMWYSAQNFGNAGWATYEIDDMVVLHDEIVNLGEIECYLNGPNLDVTEQWTPLSGTSNKDMIDDIPTDAETSYNTSNTAGQLDEFSYLAPSRTPESIFCVSLVSCVRKEESGTRTFRNFMKPGGVQHNGQDYNLSQTYQFFFDHFRTNPQTAAPWLPADIAPNTGYENRL